LIPSFAWALSPRAPPLRVCYSLLPFWLLSWGFGLGLSITPSSHKVLALPQLLLGCFLVLVPPCFCLTCLPLFGYLPRPKLPTRRRSNPRKNHLNNFSSFLLLLFHQISANHKVEQYKTFGHWGIAPPPHLPSLSQRAGTSTDPPFFSPSSKVQIWGPCLPPHPTKR